MKFHHHIIHSKCASRSLLGAVSGALLVMGCSAADRELLGDALAGLGDGHSPGPRPGGSHSGGHHPGGSGGSDPDDCVASNTMDSLYAEVANDLANLDADDAIFTRYVSLANQANAKGCGSALDVDRAALNKLVNSLSIEPTVEAPVAVDQNQTLYRIDLRDYAWDRAIEVAGTQFADVWEALTASSPYAVPFVGDDADNSVADSGTLVPVLFGNALVAAASEPPLYYATLGIPADIDDFLSADLGVDVAADPAIRAGFLGTSPARAGTEFIAERFEIQVRAGAVWQISELGADLGELFDNPLGNPAGERELVFTLPNGLQGHVVADADGQGKGASEVVVDVLENDLQAKVARSYLREHAQGPAVEDQVRQFALDNPSNFTRQELAAILALYPPEARLARILAADRSIFAEALAGLGLDINDEPEPVAQAFVSFDADLDLAAAAGDLLVSPEQLEDNLVFLDPAFGVLDSGTLDRDDFTELYLQTLCILSSVVVENQPDVSLCE
jgi:hypothetical protein